MLQFDFAPESIHARSLGEEYIMDTNEARTGSEALEVARYAGEGVIAIDKHKIRTIPLTHLAVALKERAVWKHSVVCSVSIVLDLRGHINPDAPLESWIVSPEEGVDGEKCPASFDADFKVAINRKSIAIHKSEQAPEFERVLLALESIR